MDIHERVNFGSHNEDSSNKRGFLGIHFKCCNTYGRLYRNREKTAYKGHCPVCGKSAVIPIGKGGTSSRFFTSK